MIHVFLYIKCVVNYFSILQKRKGVDSYTSSSQQPWNLAFSKDPGPHSERLEQAINNEHIISTLIKRTYDYNGSIPVVIFLDFTIETSAESTLLTITYSQEGWSIFVPRLRLKGVYLYQALSISKAVGISRFEVYMKG